MNKSDLLNDRDLVIEFLKNWPLEKIRIMRLDEYVSTEDPNTFCQYVETKTRSLGSISGAQFGSLKFGIYKRKKEKKAPKNYKSDDCYSWLPFYGENRDEAFEKVRGEIIEIIIAAQKLDFGKIDNIHLPNLFKWKIAFLYSNESFIPIYKKDALDLIARSFGLNVNKKTKYSEIHSFIAKTKPFGISVFDYMRNLYSKYRIGQKIEKNEFDAKRRKKRKGNDVINKEIQHRKGTGEYVATQFHNELKEALTEYLRRIHGAHNVTVEKNHIDVRVILPNEVQYFEVKTSGFAEDCIRDGIGQLLSYTHFEDDKRIKRLVIFGKNPPSDFENKFIAFVQNQLQNLNFKYLSLQDIEKS